MSIVAMKKVTLFGSLADKKIHLDAMQDFGFLHVIPLSMDSSEQAQPGGLSTKSRHVLKFLTDFEPRHHQVHDTRHFDAKQIENRCMMLIDALHQSNDQRDYLKKHIEDLTPWGTFDFPQQQQLAGFHLWFYTVPHYLIHKLSELPIIWQTVFQDNQFTYVVVIAEHEPPHMPVSRVHTGHLSLQELETQLESVESHIDDLLAERFSLTRWIDLFSEQLQALENQTALDIALEQTFDHRALFALQAWLPHHGVEQLQSYCQQQSLVLQISDPQENETPPTLLSNSTLMSSGEQLTKFYLTPSYFAWDPSAVLLFSFAVFFAIIISDAGYALVGFALILAFWHRLGLSEQRLRIRRLLCVIFTAALIWGVLVGSYFGLRPGKETGLALLHVVDINNQSLMMQISILLGVLHIIVANAIRAWNYRKQRQGIAALGWVSLVSGGALLWYVGTDADGWMMLASSLMVLGAGSVLLFTSKHHRHGWHRLMDGFLALTRISNAFGDVLSYLRLFALGIASASLAFAFNDLAAKIIVAAPGFGILAALIVLIVGHGLNLTLALVSGFVHGLRLNYIEFFNWCLDEEGYAFDAFCKKEKTPWNR